jgi:ubiquinone/menaquinone biosynthesis C-methylase UbiE
MSGYRVVLAAQVFSNNTYWTSLHQRKIPAICQKQNGFAFAQGVWLLYLLRREPSNGCSELRENVMTKILFQGVNMSIPEYESIKDNVKYSYDVTALDYHKLFCDELDGHEYDRMVLDRFSDNFTGNAVICDIGCGPSIQYGGYLYDKGFQIHGMDISKGCIDNARNQYPDIKYHLSDMTKTSLPDNMFDGIITFYALFHIPKQYQHEAVREFNRLLKPNGKLLLVNHKGSLTKTIDKIWGHGSINLFINFSSEDEIRKLLDDNGFTVDSFEVAKSYYEFPEERIIVCASKP